MPSRYFTLRIYILTYLLLLGLHMHAQVLKGTVTEAQTGRPLVAVTVVNIATQESVYTDERGNFALPMQTGRQVVFSFVGYKTIQKYITDEELSGGMKIALPIQRYELAELVLRPKYTPYQLDSLHRRTVYSRPLAWKRTRSIMSPVSLIADRLSHKSRERYKFQKNFTRWEDEKFVDTRYTPELVESLTGLAGDSVGYFMNAYPMPYDYARSATELELKMWIRYNYRQWIKNPVIPNLDSNNLQQK